MFREMSEEKDRKF